MLTMKKAVVLLLGGGFGLASCSDQPHSPLTAPSRPSVSATLDASRSETERNKQAITGAARFTVTNEQNREEWYVLETKADQDAPTNPLFVLARGNFLYGATGTDAFMIRGNMYCFKIERNRANLAARVEKSSNPNVHKGDYLVWRIEDNGSGKRNPPDRTTQVFLADKAMADDYCATGGDLTHPFFPVKDNLDIKDK
jgi:hypothetical protein